MLQQSLLKIKTMDYLRIEGLKIEARIGIHAWEKKIDQVLLIDLDIPRDFTHLKDAIENTIDYDALCQHVTELVQSKHFNLIETVASEILASLKAQFKLKNLTVRVSKPHAIDNAKNICVELTKNEL